MFFRPRIASLAKRMYNRASSTSTGMASLLNPTEEHFALRSALRKFVEKEVNANQMLMNLYFNANTHKENYAILNRFR